MSENNFPCGNHEARIKVLEKRVENVESEDKSNNRILNELQFLTRSVVESNERRDKIIDELSKSFSNQSITLSKINDNLDHLNKKLEDTNTRVGKLENKFYNSEEKNKIDIRDQLKILFGKWILPIGLIGNLVYVILKAFGVL